MNHECMSLLGSIIGTILGTVIGWPLGWKAYDLWYNWQNKRRQENDQ